MEGSTKLIDHEVPVLEKLGYFGWRSKMKGYLKQFGVWETMVNPPNQPSKKTKAAVEKDNKVALKLLMDKISCPIKESFGKYTSAKDLWFNMEEDLPKEESMQRKGSRSQG